MNEADNQEKVLLRRLSEECTVAFDELYSIYWKDLYGTALGMTRSSVDAEELVQDLFVDVWINRNRLNVHTSLRIYLKKALRYKLIDKIRKEKRYEEFSAYIIEDLCFNESRNPEQELITRENTSRIMDKLHILPEKCRQIFIMRRLDNRSISEIAEKLSLSPQTVKNHLHKAFLIIELNRREIAVSIMVCFL
ncbi:MAG: RNA polymerase sigma factor [Bacteroidales bacterium]